MKHSEELDQSLANRRQFIKKAILGTGVAFTAPAVLSAVRPSDLSAQASGGGSSSGPPFTPPGPPPGGGGGRRR